MWRPFTPSKSTATTTVFVLSCLVVSVFGQDLNGPQLHEEACDQQGECHRDDGAFIQAKLTRQEAASESGRSARGNPPPVAMTSAANSELAEVSVVVQKNELDRFVSMEDPHEIHEECQSRKHYELDQCKFPCKCKATSTNDENVAICDDCQAGPTVPLSEGRDWWPTVPRPDCDCGNWTCRIYKRRMKRCILKSNKTIEMYERMYMVMRSTTQVPGSSPNCSILPWPPVSGQTWHVNSSCFELNTARVRLGGDHRNKFRKCLNAIGRILSAYWIIFDGESLSPYGRFVGTCKPPTWITPASWLLEDGVGCVDTLEKMAVGSCDNGCFSGEAVAVGCSDVCDNGCMGEYEYYGSKCCCCGGGRHWESCSDWVTERTCRRHQQDNCHWDNDKKSCRIFQRISEIAVMGGSQQLG